MNNADKAFHERKRRLCVHRVPLGAGWGFRPCRNVGHYAGSSGKRYCYSHKSAGMVRIDETGGGS